MLIATNGYEYFYCKCFQLCQAYSSVTQENLFEQSHSFCQLSNPQCYIAITLFYNYFMLSLQHQYKFHKQDRKMCCSICGRLISINLALYCSTFRTIYIIIFQNQSIIICLYVYFRRDFGIVFGGLKTIRTVFELTAESFLKVCNEYC